MFYKKAFLLATSACLIAGCSVGPKYTGAPDVLQSKEWPDSKGRAPIETTLAWWKSFNDPLLDRLIDQAWQGNLDIAQAASRLEQARYMVEQAQAGAKPKLDGSLNTGINRQLYYNGYPNNTSLGNTGLNGSWDLDLFGKNKHTVEGAQASLDVSSATLDDAKLTLLSEAAKAYIDMRTMQAQTQVVESTIVNYKKMVDLTSRSYSLGDGTVLQVLQAQNRLADAQTQLPALANQIVLDQNILTMLCGEEPGKLDSILQRPAAIPQAPEPSAGMPADLLRRRPDVRKAERNLAKSIAEVGAARADQYPSLSISGQLSLSTTSIASIVASPVLAFAFGPTLNIPLLDGGVREAEVKIKQAAAKEAQLNYRQVVLNSVKEVSDGLTNLHTSVEHIKTLRALIKVSDAQVKSAFILYRNGSGTLFEVLDAEKNRDAAKEELVKVEAQQAQATVALFKALGGGWQALN